MVIFGKPKNDNAAEYLKQHFSFMFYMKYTCHLFEIKKHQKQKINMRVKLISTAINAKYGIIN